MILDSRSLTTYSRMLETKHHSTVIYNFESDRTYIEETFATKNMSKIDESGQSNAIRLLLTQLSTSEVTLLMDFVGSELKTTRHLQFYLILSQSIVLYFGCNLKTQKPIALCTKLQKSLLDRKNLLMRLFEENGSRIDYLLDMKNLKGKEEKGDVDSESDQEMEKSDNDEIQDSIAETQSVIIEESTAPDQTSSSLKPLEEQSVILEETLSRTFPTTCTPNVFSSPDFDFSSDQLTSDFGQ